MSKFDIFTIDLSVILSIIVATGVYALLLKFLQKNSPHKWSNEMGGGLFEKCPKKLDFSYPEASLIKIKKNGKNKKRTRGSSFDSFNGSRV